MLSRAERLEEFYRRLGAAPVASSFEEAYNQICDVMNEMEDELTTIPYDPTTFGRDQRLYPPQMDSEFADPNLIRARAFGNRKHTTIVGDNGAIQIVVTATRSEKFSKPGADGAGIRRLP
jgi:hypothetical protein